MGSDGVSEVRSLHIWCMELMCVRVGRLGRPPAREGALKHLENGRPWECAVSPSACEFLAASPPAPSTPYQQHLPQKHLREDRQVLSPHPMSKTPYPLAHTVTASAGLGRKPPAAVRCQAPASGFPARII